MTDSASQFVWPWQYEFPPFFTLQPNADTRSKQIDAWCELVIAYYKSRRTCNLDMKDVEGSPLFNNKTINRKASAELINAVFEMLTSKGLIEWKDKKKHECTVLWKSYQEWATIIYSWVTRTSSTQTVCTLYELTNGDDTKSEDFHGLEAEVFVKALKVLQEKGKAELISFDGNDGVKFF